MKKKPIKKLTGHHAIIQNCTFEVRPAEFNQESCSAIRALAEAAKANARARGNGRIAEGRNGQRWANDTNNAAYAG